MAEYDPIAENQTDQVIAELNTRADGDPLVNKALAAALRYMQKQGAKMDDMEKKLWTESDLDRIITQRHNALCANCPAKRAAEQASSPSKQHTTWISVLTNPSFVLSAIALLTVLMMLRMLGGQVAYRDVIQTPQTIHGGIVK